METDFSYNKKQIVSSGPFKPSGKNMPVDARTRVEVYADISSIPNPFIGMRITVLADETNSNKMTDYIVKSLKANASGIADMAIDEVVKYVDYLGVSSSGGGTGSSGNVDLTGYATETYVDNAIDVALDGHTFKFLTQAEYDVLETKDPLVEYHITDATDNNNIDTSNLASDLSLTGTSLQLKNSDGNLIGNSVSLPYNTKISQLINDSDFVNSSYVNNAISNATGDNSQIWSGKEASFLGDSITYGIRTTKKYHEYLKEYLGFSTVNNYGIDGSSVTSHSKGMCTRYSSISSTSDIVFVFGGTNDFYYGKALGEWYTLSGNTRTFNTDVTTFKGALVTICKGLINMFPSKQIILMTPIHRSTFQTQLTDFQSNSQGLFLEDYVEAIKECGKIFSIPVIDLYSKSGLYPADENNANLYFNPSVPDLLHPNASGHERIAQLIASKVKLLQPTTLTSSTVVYGNIVLNTTSLSINEGSTEIFKVKLDKQPTNNQVVNLSVNNQYCTLSTTSLTFTTSNYSTEQTVTVTAATNNSSYENKTSTITLSSTGTTSKTITVTNVNTDVTPTLNSITATYTQGSTVIYPSTSLDSLKNNLVVTANYNDSTTETVTNYSLSGTLSVGTSTITVTYNDKTTTFNVIVTEKPVSYTITNNLTNVTNNNSTTTIIEGSSYSATISANSGYEIDSYTVTMGGIDITSSSYSNGIISISNVTGNIIITVSATAVSVSTTYNKHFEFTTSKEAKAVYLEFLIDASSIEWNDVISLSFDIENASNLTSKSTASMALFGDSTGVLNNGTGTWGASSGITETITVNNDSASIDLSFTYNNKTYAYAKIPVCLGFSTLPMSFDAKNITVKVNDTETPILAFGAHYSEETVTVTNI